MVEDSNPKASCFRYSE